MSEHGNTVCATCEHLYIVHKNDSWWRWLCQDAPLPKWFNPVTGDTVADPPYARCKDRNNGDCGAFKAGPNTLNPKGEQ